MTVKVFPWRFCRELYRTWDWLEEEGEEGSSSSVVKMGWARGRAALKAAISFSLALRARISVIPLPAAGAGTVEVGLLASGEAKRGVWCGGRGAWDCDGGGMALLPVRGRRGGRES